MDMEIDLDEIELHASNSSIFATPTHLQTVEEMEEGEVISNSSDNLDSDSSFGLDEEEDESQRASSPEIDVANKEEIHARYIHKLKKKYSREVPPESRKVIVVYDLPCKSFSKDNLYWLFMPYGTIDTMVVGWEDNKSQEPPNNFAFIYYSSHEFARDACKLNNKIVGGNQIKVWQLFDFD